MITGAVEAAMPVAHANVLALDGTFTLNVPAGEYSVKVTGGGKNFVTHWLSYENADWVKLERGGCAQIQFVPSDSADAMSANPGQ